MPKEAMVVIVLRDEPNGEVNMKIESHPAVKDGEESGAQRLAGTMLGAVSEAIAKPMEEDLSDHPLGEHHYELGSDKCTVCGKAEPGDLTPVEPIDPRI